MYKKLLLSLLLLINLPNEIIALCDPADCICGCICLLIGNVLDNVFYWRSEKNLIDLYIQKRAWGEQQRELRSLVNQSDLAQYARQKLPSDLDTLSVKSKRQVIETFYTAVRAGENVPMQYLCQNYKEMLQETDILNRFNKANKENHDIYMQDSKYVGNDIAKLYTIATHRKKHFSSKLKESYLLSLFEQKVREELKNKQRQSPHWWKEIILKDKEFIEAKDPEKTPEKN